MAVLWVPMTVCMITNCCLVCVKDFFTGDQQVAKIGSVYLLIFHWDSMIMDEAITTIEIRQNSINHLVLHSQLIVHKERK